LIPLECVVVGGCGRVELYLAGQGVEGIWSSLRQPLLCLLMQFLLGLREAREVIIRAKLVQIL